MKRLLLFLTFCVFANAKSLDMRVSRGNIKMIKKDKYTSITHDGHRAVIEWERFSIKKEEEVNFIQKNSNSAILNRVTGDEISKIDGLLSSNGKVYLLNPNGILIGKDGIINTNGFIASTLEISDQCFLENGEQKFHGLSKKSVINLGKIQSEKDIYLIATTINNQGEIISGTQAHLLAANEVYLQEDRKILIDPKINGLVSNSGLIKAAIVDIQSSGGNISSLAINHDGIIDATGIQRIGGRVVLKSLNGKTEINGKIKSRDKIHILGETIEVKDKAIIDVSGDCKGKEILIGGDYQGKNPTINNAKHVSISKKAKLLANGSEQSSGGKIIIWADDTNHFFGQVEAKGGRQSGDGGFIEISCPKDLVFKGSVCTLSPNGKTGKFLLDPSNIYIDDFDGESDPEFPTGPSNEYNPSSGEAFLDVNTLASALGSSNVTIATSNGDGGQGAVSIDAGFSWSAPTTLEILADCNIVVNSGVSITNTATGNFTAFDFQANKNGPALEGSFNGILLRGAKITSNEGDVYLTALGGTSSFNQGIVLSEYASILSNGLGASAAKITLQGQGANAVSYTRGVCLASGKITTIDGDVMITGTSGGSEIYNYGVSLESMGTIESIGSGNITINALSNLGTDQNIGFNLEGSSAIQTVDGYIHITGTSNAVGRYNRGINLNRKVNITSTGIGRIEINGTSGSGFYRNNSGLYMVYATVASTRGDITVNAVSNGTDNYNRGIEMYESSSILSKGTDMNSANITITANSGSGRSENHALYLNNYSEISTYNGDVNITATSYGTGDYNHGILLNYSSGIHTTGPSSNPGNIDLITQGGTGSYETIGVQGKNSSYVISEGGQLSVIGGLDIE